MWNLLEERTRGTEAMKKFRVDTCPIRPSFKVIAIFLFQWSATVYLRTKCSKWLSSTCIETCSRRAEEFCNFSKIPRSNNNNNNNLKQSRIAAVHCSSRFHVNNTLRITILSLEIHWFNGRNQCMNRHGK